MTEECISIIYDFIQDCKKNPNINVKEWLKNRSKIYDEPSQTFDSSPSKEILNLLKHGRVMYLYGISRKLKMRAPVVRFMLEDLEERGLVRRIDDGSIILENSRWKIMR